MSRTIHVNCSVIVCVREVEADEARGCSRVAVARPIVFRRVAAALPIVSLHSPDAVIWLLPTRDIQVSAMDVSGNQR